MSNNVKCDYIFFKPDIEQKIKLWTPKPMVDTASLSALPMENYIIDGKVNTIKMMLHSHVLSPTYKLTHGKFCINYN